MSYLTLTFLGIVLVTQSYFVTSKPWPVDDQKFDRNNKLYKGTLAKFVNFATQWGERYGKVLDRVVEDLEAEGKGRQNADEVEHLKEIADLSKHLKAGSDDETLRNIMDLDEEESGIKQLMEKYSNLDHVLALVYKDGKDTVTDFYKNLLKFFDGFNKALEEFTKNMSEEEKAQHKHFLEWFKKYEEVKEKYNILEQSRLFLDFFKFFNPNV
ncbi:uncharacterized protein ACN2A1_010292 [Glossina fuscipes fuscipes]